MNKKSPEAANKAAAPATLPAGALRDKFAGQGGSYVFNSNTGVRTKAVDTDTQKEQVSNE